MKPGKLGQKVVDAYQKTENAFTRKFLQEDPSSPSGYSLKTGKTAEQAAGVYNKIETGVVGAYKKVENTFVDAFLEKTEDTRPDQPDGGQEN